MSDAICPIEVFTKLVEPLVGLTVALPWKGFGSAIFLELGKLQPVESTRRDHTQGEACVSIEWNWRVEQASSVLYGSSNSGPRIQRGIAGLQGLTIAGLSITGQVPELTVTFTNGSILRSMVMLTGNPEWSIKLPDGRWVFARAGQLHLGQGSSDTSEEEEKAFNLAESTAARWEIPLAQPALGHCLRCTWFVPIDGQGHLLDYGVCTSGTSPFDGKAVNCASGCPAYVDGT